MPHPLEMKYGLTSAELLDAIDRRFRLKVALEGAVAEVHFERKLKIASKEGWLTSYEAHDVDGMHDFSLVTLQGRPIRVEVKTIRKERPGKVKVPEVELQKTRAAKGDPSSRYYDRTHVDLLAVCMGRTTGDWSEFAYALISELPEHKLHPAKLQVMHGLIFEEGHKVRWFRKLQDAIDAYEAIVNL